MKNRVWEREVEAQTKLGRHKNVVKILESGEKLLFKRDFTSQSFIGTPKKYIVLEYVDKGDIFDHLMASEFGFSEQIARYFMRHIMLALDHMHFRGYSHRDIKLENLLLD